MLTGMLDYRLAENGSIVRVLQIMPQVPYTPFHYIPYTTDKIMKLQGDCVLSTDS
jgi:hypothetical protein